MAKLHQLVSWAIPLVLTALVIIAAVALHRIHNLSLPISDVIGIAGLLLPIATGVGLQSTRSLLKGSSGSARKVSPWVIVPLFVILVMYETVIATLAILHIFPTDNFMCALDRTWDRLFRSKDGAAIRRIQDAHQCCGLHSIRDRAWPFPSRDHGADACANAFNRTRACLGSWRKDEQVTAGLLLLVALVTFFLKVIVLFLAQRRNSWLHQVVPGWRSAIEGVAGVGEIGENGEYPDRDRRRIEGAYRDDTTIENNIDAEPASETERITNRNPSTNERQINQGPAMQPSGPNNEDNAWR